MQDSLNLPLPSPTWTEGSSLVMQLEANLQDLSLCQFEIEIECTGLELAQIFEQYPLLPGAVLVEQATFVGMISRRRLLEYLLHPYGLELFLKQSLRVLHSYARREMLLLSGETPILSAAQQALRRSPDLQDEPVVVQVTPKSYYLLDIHALNIASWQIRGIETQVRYERTQVEMIQSDKMANLGRLVDGIAHEILDPVSFIWGNLSHVSSYCNDLLALLSLYEMAMPSPPMAILHRREELEIDYLRKDLPQTIKSIRAGAERLSKLATSLQNFCHVDEVYPKPANLHEMLDSILLLLQSRLSSEICFVKNYGQLPPVPCFAGQLNQVFMNILSMAVDTLLSQAISQELESDLKTREPATIAPYPKFQPTITITTQVCSLPSSDRESRWISICIANNGLSLSAEMQQQIRESFSIKRRALKETSLTVSYQIITAKHGGKFEIRSPRSSASAQVATAIDEGGTEFEILLPLI